MLMGVSLEYNYSLVFVFQGHSWICDVFSSFFINLHASCTRYACLKALMYGLASWVFYGDDELITTLSFYLVSVLFMDVA